MRRLLGWAVAVAALSSCVGAHSSEPRETRADAPSVERLPSGVLDRYLAAITAAERVAIVESITESTPESRRVLVLAFDGHDPDVFPAAADTICRRFVGYVPPGGFEGRCLIAEEWLDAHAR